ncbi:hypothetical protein QJQ45_021497 [Haematococcus lacustris]|nr:hypothetical protein QJQ45_021497 [Haematococcus lacustris]
MLRWLSRLDAYPKVRDEEFFTRTLAGGVITMTSSVIMLLLFLSELHSWAVINTQHELMVDSSRGETIRINVDLTFPHMPCSWLSLDAMDVSGDLHLDVQDHDIYKQRLSANGNPLKEAARHDVASTKAATQLVNGNVTCGACYGAEEAEGQCCNTCDEVRAAYRKKGWAFTGLEHIDQCKHDEYIGSIKEQAGEGCRMWGHLEVNKVAGNFHFAPGRSYQQGSMHVHDIAPFGDARMDFSHTINKLSFGTPFPGMVNPLDNTKSQRSSQAPHAAPTGMFQYFLKVVPTSYTPLKNRTAISSNQFSVTENFKEASGAAHSLPGVFFFYDLSPIKVQIKEVKSNFTSFLTSVCAIIGGVFTVAGIVDGLFYQGERLIKQKMQIGKLS